MMVRAKASFAGACTMYAGETRELADGEVLRDLLAAGYVEEEPEEQPKNEPENDPEEPTREQTAAKGKRAAERKE